MQFLIKNNHADLLILKQIKVRSNEINICLFHFGLNRMLYAIQYVIQLLLSPMVTCYLVQPVINFFGRV